MIQISVYPLQVERCVLGEGLLWDYETERLLYVDIELCTLFSYDLESGIAESWKFNEKIGWVQLTTRNGAYILGFQSGIAVFDRAMPEKMTWLVQEFPADPECRLNDSFVDSNGVIWFGSMRITPPLYGGKLASFSVKHGLRVHDEGYGVTNGPVVLKDQARMLHNDSEKGITYEFMLTDAGQRVENKREWLVFQPEQGSPDGMVSDTEGNVWIAMWGAGEVLKIQDDGKILQSYTVPAKNVTNICFGGRDLDRMFVTTAMEIVGSDRSCAESRNLDGCLFEITGHGSKGLRSNKFGC